MRFSSRARAGAAEYNIDGFDTKGRAGGKNIRSGRGQHGSLSYPYFIIKLSPRNRKQVMCARSTERKKLYTSVAPHLFPYVECIMQDNRGDK